MNRFLRFSFITAICSSTLLAIPTYTRAESEYWNQKTSLYEILPVNSTDIVFLGNSITDGGEFAELFNMPNIKNRGINSDVVGGVKKRLDQILRGKPAKIFLLIGINDVSHAKSAEKIAEEYRELVKEIRTKSPDTRLFIQSVMPIDNSFNRYKNLKGRESVIPALNKHLENIAEEEGCRYVDLWPALADSKGNLKKGFTVDGLHLTGVGYQAWAKLIENLVKE